MKSRCRPVSRAGRWAGSVWPILLTLAVGPALATPVRGAEGALPTIVAVTTPPRPVTGAALDFGIVYRAPQANVVAVDQTVEDLAGPLVQRTTRQRRVSVVAQAFGREAGELRMTVAFGAPGRRRLTFTLVTDEGDESEPQTVEVDVGR